METTTTKDPADVMEAVEFRGIRLAAIGDDGDVLVAFGHHDPDVVAAAMTEMGQAVLGWTLPVEADEVDQRWGHLMTSCEACDNKPNCRDCAIIRSHDGWMAYDDDSDGPGRFPIMVVDAS